VYNLGSIVLTGGGESEERMYVDLLPYRFRIMFAGVATVAFLLFISALVTNIGSGTILDARTNQAAAVMNGSAPDTSNAVTVGMYNLEYNTKRFSLSAGTTLFGVCRSITSTATQTGHSIAHASIATVEGIGAGTVFIARTIAGTVIFSLHSVGSGVAFVFNLPGKMVAPVAQVHTVSSLIQPANDNPIPVINTGLSPELLARLNAQAEQDQKKDAALQAAQLAANQHLGGAAVAGDPHHGGYPTAWDSPTPQDSRLDSWGMYNRECVSYAAWKVYQTYGDMPYWGGVGNANQWVRDARNAGIPTSTVPQVHSVAISMSGYYGHAMWVEAVDGNMIYVSQYNYDLHGHYSEMWVSSSYLTYIYFKQAT